MATFAFMCPDGHETEVQHPLKGGTPFEEDTEGHQVVDCGMCPKKAIRLFCGAPAIYNSSGFYGSAGTQMAHNLGIV